MELCEKLKQIRKENNLTQQQLADELCLSRTVITKYERGHKVPNLDTIILISNYFKTSIFDEYKNKFKLFILSIRCCIPYLISLILLIISSTSLVCNIINVNNQYGYNIYNDELKVKNSEGIYIIKYTFMSNESHSKFMCVSSLKIKNEFASLLLLPNMDQLKQCDYYLFFLNDRIDMSTGFHYEVNKKLHKPFIYTLKDYDESLLYNEQTGECSKILNYYIDLIEKVK